MDFPVFDLPILYTFIQDAFIGVLSGTGIAVLTLLDMRDRSIRSINTGIKVRGFPPPMRIRITYLLF